MKKLSKSMEHDLYLRRVALGEIEGERTGYPSVDKPWLKYYSEEAIQAELPECSMYEYLWQNNREHPKDIALNYFGNKMTYGELFENIDLVARAFAAQGVKAGDVCTIASLSCVPSVLCLYALNKIGAIPNYTNILATENDLKKYFENSKPQFLVTLDLFYKEMSSAAREVGIKKLIVFSLTEWMPLPMQTLFRLKMGKEKTSLPDREDVVCWKDFLHSAETVRQIGEWNKSVNGNKVALLAHTGGTTGFPKCVQLSDKAINTVACQYNLCMEHQRQETFLNIIVPRPVYGTLVCLHMPLCLGLEVVLNPKFEAKDWGQYFKKYHPVLVSEKFPSLKKPASYCIYRDLPAAA